MSWGFGLCWTNGDLSVSSGIPSCQRAQLEERRHRSSVRPQSPSSSGSASLASRYRWTVGCALRPGAAFVRSDPFAAAVGVTEQQPVPVAQHVAPRRQQYPSGSSAFGGQQTGKPTAQQPGCPAVFTAGRQQLGKSVGQQVPKGSSAFGAQQKLLFLQNAPKKQQRSVFETQRPRLAPCSLQHFRLQHWVPNVQTDPVFLHAAAASRRPR
jgi:hypothetical protein